MDLIGLSWTSNLIWCFQPLWKIWLRQLGWLETQLNGKIKNGNQTTNQLWLFLGWAFQQALGAIHQDPPPIFPLVFSDLEKILRQKGLHCPPSPSFFFDKWALWHHVAQSFSKGVEVVSPCNHSGFLSCWSFKQALCWQLSSSPGMCLAMSHLSRRAWEAEPVQKEETDFVLVDYCFGYNQQLWGLDEVLNSCICGSRRKKKTYSWPATLEV